MKTQILSVVVSLLTLTVSAQQQEESRIFLSLKKGDSISSPVLSRALISVLNGTQDFMAAIALFPIVPGKNTEDSLQEKNKPLILTLKGQFPVENIDFLTTGDNGKTYTMNVSARLNDSLQYLTLNFSITIPRDAPDNPNGNIAAYQARMMFTLMLNPVSFGLNQPPFDINNTILVQVTDAAISKLNNTFEN